MDDDHEGRRTVAALLGATGIGVLAILAMFWMLGSASASPLKAFEASAGGAGASAGSAVDAAAVAAATSSSASTPTTATSTAPLPSPSYATHSLAYSLPPPEQPTLTAPVPGETADSTDPATTTSVGASTPPVITPVTGASTPAGSGPSGVVLTCVRHGETTVADLSFTTGTAVAVWLLGGGHVESGTAGPGAVHLTASGKRASYCMATIGSQRVGPIAAR